MTVEAEALEGLPEDIVARLLTGLGLDRGPLRIAIQDERMLSRNRELAEARLRELVEAALAPPPPPRRPTRPSRAAREARVETKRGRAAIKRLRRPPEP